MVVDQRKSNEINTCLLNLNKNIGEMTEWFKVADCKSVRFSYRRFKSCFLQQIIEI